MKKLLSILCIIAICLPLFACRTPSVTPGPSETVPTEATPAETTPVETAPTETVPPETTPAETTAPVTEPPETEPVETVPPETEPVDPETLDFTEENYPLIDGSTSTKPLAKALQEEFTGAENVEITHSKSHQSYLNLVDGKCDMILAVEPSRDEYSYADRHGVTFQIDKVTNEGFVFFVNKRNPVESLTLQQIRDIYSGKITNWKDVGGNDAEIVAFQRPTNSGSQTGMLSLVMGDTPMMDPVTGTVADTMSAIVDVISAFDSGENAIGYSYYYYANTMYLGENVKLIAVEGVKPNNTTIREGQYPLLTAYYAITRKGDASENTQRLLQGILSERGQKAVQRAGYVPVIDVGAYDPENPEASSEKTLSLNDTYSMNPVRVLQRTDTYEGYEFVYGELTGLSDVQVQEKINRMLYDDALAAFQKGAEKAAQGASARSYLMVEANFSNVLSVKVQYQFAKYQVSAYEVYGGTNVRLDTGERLQLQDLFITNAKGKDIFNADFYGEMVFRTKSNQIYGSAYADTEERILEIIQDFNAGETFNFWFSPREVVLLDRIPGNYPILELWFSNCMEEVVIYDKYANAEVSYDGRFSSDSGIPVLMDRDNPVLSSTEKTGDYYLDAALYAEGAFSTVEIPELYREQILTFYEEYVEELRKELQEKAAAGTYCYYEVNAMAQVPGWDTAPNLAYALNLHVYLREWDSREAFESAYDRMLKAIRSQYWDTVAGMNHYIFGTTSYDTDPVNQFIPMRGCVWYFDELGNLAAVEK